MSKRKWTDEQLKVAVLENKSIAGVIRQLGLKPAGGNYASIQNKIKELNLDITHFTGRGWNVGLKFKPYPPKPLSEILVKNSNYQSYKLFKRLIKEGLKEKKCECCDNTIQMNNPIALELHYVNGIHSDNRFENLQILCPNCHAMTNNYRGRNIGKSTQEEMTEVNEG